MELAKSIRSSLSSESMLPRNATSQPVAPNPSRPATARLLLPIAIPAPRPTYMLAPPTPDSAPRVRTMSSRFSPGTSNALSHSATRPVILARTSGPYTENSPVKSTSMLPRSRVVSTATSSPLVPPVTVRSASSRVKPGIPSRSVKPIEAGGLKLSSTPDVLISRSPIMSM